MRVLDRVASQRGKPQTIRGDNGPEFLSRSLDLWAYFNGVKLDFSRPGKPTDNAFLESFNGRLRVECLNQHWFLSLDEARAVRSRNGENVRCQSDCPSSMLTSWAISVVLKPRTIGRITSFKIATS